MNLCNGTGIFEDLTGWQDTCKCPGCDGCKDKNNKPPIENHPQGFVITENFKKPKIK